MILETERLILRKITQADYLAIATILEDDEIMASYAGAFSHDLIKIWIDKQQQRYIEDGFGLMAVVLKQTNEVIGQCGLTMQDYKNHQILEIGYLFNKNFWHQGYATEAAIACKQYAFNTLKANEVYSIIRDSNIASQKIALRNGMNVIDTMTKHYRGVDMLHFVYCIKNPMFNNH